MYRSQRLNRKNNPDSSSRWWGLFFTIAVHCVLFWSLAYGLEKSEKEISPPPQSMRLTICKKPVEALRPSAPPVHDEPLAEPEVISVPRPEPVSPEPEPALKKPETKKAVAKEKPRKKKKKVKRKTVKRKTPPPEQAEKTASRSLKKPVKTEAAAPANNPSRSTRPAVQPPSPSDEQRKRELISTLLALIEKEKYYPFAARRAGLTGKVVLMISVNSDGRISGYRIAGGNGHATLKKAALTTMGRVAKNRIPVSSLPNGATIRLPINYSITSN